MNSFQLRPHANCLFKKGGEKGVAVGRREAERDGGRL